jgi:hypothetical protein
MIFQIRKEFYINQEPEESFVEIDLPFGNEIFYAQVLYDQGGAWIVKQTIRKSKEEVKLISSGMYASNWGIFKFDPNGSVENV